MLEIRKSTSQKNYYILLEIDSEHNENLLAEGTLAKIKEHPKYEASLEPVSEATTRNRFEAG